LRTPATDSIADPPCPLCGEPLYAWIVLPGREAEASVGLPLRSESERVLGRCENCGAALERGVEVDLAQEWAAIAPNGAATLSVPNQASLQAAIGVEGWAAMPLARGRLLLTPTSLGLLAARTGHLLDRVRTPISSRGQAWMWQTLLNGLTFHPNFGREVRGGRLRPATARGRLAFTVDAVVTVLGAPLVALLSVPLELVAALARRGGEITATVARG